MISDNKVTYHEVDFLLPAQRFNIQFSYVSQKGLPFIREFVLRLVHVASMSKAQIATYFGLTHRETEGGDFRSCAAWRIDALLRRQTGLNRQIKWLFFRGWRDTASFNYSGQWLYLIL